MLVSRRFSFDAAHFLPNYEGKCKNLHGHHWEVEVACSGEINEDTGMVIDFTKLKEFCESIKEQFDHTCLNEVGFPNPTAENICKFIEAEFSLWCGRQGVKLEYIRVWETENSMVEMRIRR